MNKKQTAETPEGMIVLGKNGEIDVEKTRLLQMQDLERRQTAAAERAAEMTAQLVSVVELIGEILREQFDRIVEKLEPIAMMFGDDDDDAAVEHGEHDCEECILDGTDACQRGAGRAVDSEICDDFIAEDEEPQDFKEGELIVYQNGDTFQIGEIKRLCSDGAFVWYHKGDTASKTSFENMHKLQNAFCITKTSFAEDRPRCGSCTNFMSCEELSDVSAWDDASSCDDYEEGD